MKRSWTFAIDRGGTFTDVVARADDGAFRVEKLLSENPGQYDDAALEAIRRVLDEEGGAVAEVRMCSREMRMRCRPACCTRSFSAASTGIAAFTAGGRC